MDIVIDTNVVIAAMLSRRGKASQLLRLIDSKHFQVHVSIPLVLEYEYVALELMDKTAYTEVAIADLLDYICEISKQHKIYYLWRPFLKDPMDDMVLEVAVAGQCNAIITYNQRDFIGIEQFGVHVMTPKELLEKVGLL